MHPSLNLLLMKMSLGGFGLEGPICEAVVDIRYNFENV